MIAHMFKDASVFHFSINCTISAWGQRDLALRLDDNLAIVADCGDAALREENNWVGMVAEEVVGLEVGADFLVVHFAGHDVPLDHVGVGEDWVGKLFFGETHQTDEAVGEEAKKGQFGVETQVEHAFGVIEAKTSALTSAHDTNADFPFGNRFQTNHVELISNFVQLCSRADIFNRQELKLLISFFEFGFKKDVGKELIGLL